MREVIATLLCLGMDTWSTELVLRHPTEAGKGVDVSLSQRGTWQDYSFSSACFRAGVFVVGSSQLLPS